MNLNDPPIAGTDNDSGVSFTMHDVGGSIFGGSCVTAMASPPILTEPDRAADVSFALTPNLLVPDPATEPVGMPIHGASVPVTDHLQSADADTEKTTSCAAAVSLTLLGSTEAGQGAGGSAGASWVTAIASPPILTEPARAVRPSFALTLNLLAPGPVTDPVGMPIHAASVPVTDHLQSADAEIVKATSCAAAVSLTLRGSTVVGQGGGGGASWVTTIVRPPTSTLPERNGPSLTVTRNVPVAEPAPEGVAIRIHDVPVDTDHRQSAAAETANDTVSPLAFT